MDFRDDQNHVFNISLAKSTGLYKFLDPETTKYRGKNLYRIVLTIISLYSGVNGIILSIHGVYYWTNNLSLSIDYFWNSFYTLFMCYSLLVSVQYSDDIWNCLSITCYGFTSHSLQNRHILDRWRDRSVFLTNIITVTYLLSAIIYYGSSLVLSNYIIEVKNHDGSVSNYRYNVLNYYLFLSEETYNSHYYIMNLIECMGTANFLVALIVFDVLGVTFCLAVTCQMQMISAAFESVGYTSLGDHHLSLIDCRGEKKNLPNTQNLMYDQIKTIIMDHQAVMSYSPLSCESNQNYPHNHFYLYGLWSDASLRYNACKVFVLLIIILDNNNADLSAVTNEQYLFLYETKGSTFYILTRTLENRRQSPSLDLNH
ncbi:hypothetical protein QTP88_022865 [Uroleucon formosanum]